MVSCNKGDISISGEFVEISAEMSTLLYGYKQCLLEIGFSEDRIRDFVNFIVENALETDDDADDDELRDNLVERIGEDNVKLIEDFIKANLPKDK